MSFARTPAAVTTWEYRPGTNALWKKTDAANHSTIYAYDAGGLLTTRTNARGGVATRSYAQTTGGNTIPGRVSGISYSNDGGLTPPVAFTYHADGSLRTATDAGGTQGINLSGSSALARNVVVYGSGLLNGVVLNRAHLDEDRPQTIQLSVAGAPIVADGGGNLSYNPVPVFARAYGWMERRLTNVGNVSYGGLSVQPSTNASYSYLNGRVRHRYVQGLNYRTSYRYMPDGAVLEIATQTQRYNYNGQMVGRGGYADEWYYDFDARGRREKALWTDMYEPDFQNRPPKQELEEGYAPFWRPPVQSTEPVQTHR